ncbi:hypothetical protein PFFCH_05458 [Plasmodium falciparum FCH/4]|uniref:Uncharacterized protein n=1 Tax=Plasmodium falciparum FCH/4 TaxID=1036724 RepID=A0A024VF54_PLAFA|nr:hypothetical protein PFFCH_05458 [Plasmodium falciparum FCH/4]
MKKKTSKDGKVSKYKNHNKDEKYDEKSLKINKKMNCTKEKHGKNKNENTNNPLNDNKNERIHKKREAILEEVIPAKIIDTYRNNRNQNMNKNVKNESVRSCISCFCCGWDADDEAMNELLLEEERKKLKLLEEERKRLKLHYHNSNDIRFFKNDKKMYMKHYTLNYVEIEKPVEFTGNYLFVIQKGLDIFKKEINVEALLSYLNSYGSLLSLS